MNAGHVGHCLVSIAQIWELGTQVILLIDVTNGLHWKRLGGGVVVCAAGDL